MIPRWTLAVIVAATAAACGGGVTQHDSGDGGPVSGDSGVVTVDASSGCAPLATCCTTLTGPAQSLCEEVVGSGNAQDCATELGQLRAEGACVTQTGSEGGGPDSSMQMGDSSLQMNPDAQGQDAGPDAGPDGPTPPASCTGVSCTPPLVCNVLPGGSATCVPPCHADSDCPAWTTCQGGLCSSQCSTCPAGQTCQPVVFPSGRQCTSNNSCGVGQYCQSSGFDMCTPYMICQQCTGGCPSCTSNNQCMPGQVCAGNQCVTCTSSSQCGPTAVCGSTHTGTQCTCTVDGDCQSSETCSSGICQPTYPQGCNPPFGSCPIGQACIGGTCGACSTFNDCNQPSQSPQPLQGLACIGGTCTACTANSQCGEGMACVAGTCGTCATNAQCGASGLCTDGYCMCTSDAQCGTGQRCGGGVCVSM